MSILIASDCYAQFTDNFSDGDFTNNPAWSGDNSKFAINAGKLKLQAPAVSESASLFTASQAIHLASWEFYLQMDFTPSSTNYARIYLVSDQSNLAGPLNGYSIKIGNTTREVSLYRQSGTTEVKIIDGLDDRVNQAIVKLRIKVTRNASGLWQVYSDIGPSGSYNLEGTVTDNTFVTSSYFGFNCTYTSTRSDKFWFDDFVVTGTSVPDTTPPSLISANASDSRNATLIFSEALERSSSESAGNYQVASIGVSDQAQLQLDQKTVRIHFSSPLINGVSYTLQVDGVRDLVGNPITSTKLPIMYFQSVPSKKKDIVFSEIFPDPSPQIGLPNAEFVEVYNRGPDPFNINGWKLSDGSSTGIFPSQIILPGEYWIVCASSSSILFSNFGKTLGLSNFPTLNNGGDIITLRNASNQTIDSINYTIEWYRDVDKQEGGWTIELIDPANPCGEADNWQASTDPRGGTPGKKNSVFANKPDLTPPQVLSVFPENAVKLALTFSEKLGNESLGVQNYVFDPAVQVTRALFGDGSLRTIRLILEDSLKERRLYSLTIKGVRDCAGNEMVPVSLSFGLPEDPDSLDVVINEILFNPKSGGVDFVEIYNTTTKFLNLSQWKIGTSLNETPTDIVELFPGNTMLSPSGYAVFTPGPDIIKLQYPQSIERDLFKIALPSLQDDKGAVVILDNRGKQIDNVSYSQSWHSVFVKNNEGISLERIEPQGPSNNQVNWTSAASAAGYATPGYVNSQFARNVESPEGEVLVIPEIFSPDNVGNEFARIEYHFDQGGWVANVDIIDQQHRHLKTIAVNETIGPEGFFRWDGDRDDGTKARMGYYVIQFETFKSDGSVRMYLKRVIVSSRQ